MTDSITISIALDHFFTWEAWNIYVVFMRVKAHRAERGEKMENNFCAGGVEMENFSTKGSTLN